MMSGHPDLFRLVEQVEEAQGDSCRYSRGKLREKLFKLYDMDSRKKKKKKVYLYLALSKCRLKTERKLIVFRGFGFYGGILM